MAPGLTNGIGPWVLAVLGLALLSTLVATLRAWRDARYSPYFLLRQQAARRMRRLGLALLGVLTAALLVAVFFATRPPVPWPALPALPVIALPSAPTRAPSATPVVEPSTVAASATPAPSATPTLAAPPTRNVPHTPSTPTPVRTLPAAILTPVTPLATPLPGAHFGPVTMASSISDSGFPLVITDTYRTGSFRIYAVFTAVDLAPGVAWSYAWVRDGTPLVGETALWKATTPELPLYRYYMPADGWLPGNYEFQLFIGDRPVSVGTFRVLP
jgi:hypothetical protein